MDVLEAKRRTCRDLARVIVCVVLISAVCWAAVMSLEAASPSRRLTVMATPHVAHIRKRRAEKQSSAPASTMKTVAAAVGAQMRNPAESTSRPRVDRPPRGQGAAGGGHEVAKRKRAYFQEHWHPGTDAGADCARMHRTGPPGDGGKMICLDAVPAPSEPCFVLSVGVGGLPGRPPDFRFALALHEQMPHCRIHVYDGTNFGRGVITNAPPFVHLFPENFTPETWQRYKQKRVDMFKIDCEGCEFNCIPPMLANVDVDLIMVEVHPFRDIQTIDRFMKTLTTKHGIYYREPNIQHTDGTCIEFALRRRNQKQDQ